MEIRVPCSHCGKVLLVKDVSAARVGTCPNCHHKVMIARPGPHDTPSKPADTPPAARVLRNTKGSPVPSVPPAGRSSAADLSDDNSNLPDDERTRSRGTSAAGSDSGAKNVPASNSLKQSPTKSLGADPLSELPDTVWFVRSPGGGQYGPASNQVMRMWITEGRVGTQSLVWRAGWADWLPADRVFDSMLDSPLSPSGSTGSLTSKAALYLEKKRHRRSLAPTVWILIGLALLALAAFFIIIF